MKKIKTFEGFFKKSSEYRTGSHDVTIIDKIEKSGFLEDKYFLEIEFSDGFTQEVEVDCPSYVTSEIGQKTTFNL